MAFICPTGILHWSLNLKPKEKRQFRIAYQVEYPAELILETRRKQAMQERSASGARRAASPSPARARDIGDQLNDLEAQF